MIYVFSKFCFLDAILEETVMSIATEIINDFLGYLYDFDQQKRPLFFTLHKVPQMLPSLSDPGRPADRFPLKHQGEKRDIAPSGHLRLNS
jgi:hypothetical protein